MEVALFVGLVKAVTAIRVFLYNVTTGMARTIEFDV